MKRTAVVYATNPEAGKRKVAELMKDGVKARYIDAQAFEFENEHVDNVYLIGQHDAIARFYNIEAEPEFEQEKPPKPKPTRKKRGRPRKTESVE